MDNRFLDYDEDSSDSFRNPGSELSGKNGLKKLSTFSDDTEAPLISAAYIGKFDNTEKGCTVSDSLQRSEYTGDSDMSGGGVNSDNAAGNEYDELERLLVRLRERAKYAAQSDRGYNSNKKYQGSDYTVSVPRGTSQSQTGLICSYEPTHPMIRKVDVLEWPSKYNFYEKFHRDAVRYYKIKGKECEYVDFVSFVPQYSMMTADQKEYYLWWRTCLRYGKKIRTAKSYILLLIYEIINLPELLLPKDGVALICKLIYWYPENIHGIRNSVAPWLRDYCLIHGVEIPEEYMDRVAEYAGRYTALPEFYVKYDTATGTADPQSLLLMISKYSWKESKYLTKENRSQFEKYLSGAMAVAYRAGGDETPFDVRHLPAGQYIAESYSGAVCTSKVKCRLRVTYCKCSHTDEIHDAAGTVKYAENQARRLLGIKARFKVFDLSKRRSDAIDSYFKPMFDEALQKKDLERHAAAEDHISSEYSKLYEAESTGMSFEHALEIEKISWEVTEKLVDAFEVMDVGEAETVTVPQSEIACDTNANMPPNERFFYSKTGKEEKEENKGDKSFLRRGVELLLECDKEGFEVLAREKRLLPDTLAEQINDEFINMFGDIVLEPDGENYTVIEDYRTEAEDYANGGMDTDEP